MHPTTQAIDLTDRIIRKDKRFAGWQHIANIRHHDTPVVIRVRLLSPYSPRQVTFDLYNHDTLKGYVKTLRGMLDKAFNAIGPTQDIV